MRRWSPYFLGLIGLFVFVTPGHSAERFFLMMAGEPPDQSLVTSAHREAVRAGGVLDAEKGRFRVGKVFPRLFGARPLFERNAVEGDLQLARAAHMSGQFQESEDAFQRASSAVLAQPELVTGQPELLQRLVDGAALRLTTGILRKKSEAEITAQVEAFVRRFPFLSPSTAEHPPAVQKRWNMARETVRSGASPLVVNVHPLELERGGTCRVHVNGAEVAELPMPGPVQMPAGDHFLQVRCGTQSSWLMRVELDGRPRTLRVPVRAMLAARGDSETGGIVLVDPGERDSAVLVDAVSDATGLAGASVARTATAKVEFGLWEAGMSGPTVQNIGAIDGGDIVSVRRADAKPAPGGGRVWTWVTGGVGLAALGGAVVANVMYEDKRQDGAGDTELSGFQTAATSLYIAGGALLVTSVILFFVEGDSPEEAVGWGSTRPGAVLVRF